MITMLLRAPFLNVAVKGIWPGDRVINIRPPSVAIILAGVFVPAQMDSEGKCGAPMQPNAATTWVLISVAKAKRRAPAWAAGAGGDFQFDPTKARRRC